MLTIGIKSYLWRKINAINICLTSNRKIINKKLTIIKRNWKRIFKWLFTVVLMDPNIYLAEYNGPKHLSSWIKTKKNHANCHKKENCVIYFCVCCSIFPQISLIEKLYNYKFVSTQRFKGTITLGIEHYLKVLETKTRGYNFFEIRMEFKMSFHTWYETTASWESPST